MNKKHNCLPSRVGCHIGRLCVCKKKHVCESTAFTDCLLIEVSEEHQQWCPKCWEYCYNDACLDCQKKDKEIEKLKSKISEIVKNEKKE